MGDRGRRARDVHAGGLRLPRGRLLAGEERRARGRQDPDQLLDRLCYWAVGFALAFGGSGTIAGTHGFFLNVSGDPAAAADKIPILKIAGISPAALLFFQFVFCAVSLAIVWGTTLERIKFSAYVIYAVIFSAVIYPILSHWIFGGGWLQVNVGMQDFAGSTVVHLIGATGGAGGAAAARPAPWASTAPTASRGRSRGTPCRSSAWAS